MKRQGNLEEYASVYHHPVMWREIARYFIVNTDGIYIDCTLGGGGHSELILNRISDKGRVIGLDRDADALKFAGERLGAHKNFTAVKSPFSALASVAEELGIGKADGILMDLGVSSYQIDTAARGFSFSEDGPLDMRMDRETGLTAEEVLNTYAEEDLANIFYRFGEEKRSRAIARAVCLAREKHPLKTTRELKEIIGGIYPPNKAVKAYARVFQSVRIFVNGELDELDRALSDGFGLLKKNGRLAVIAYHSLEDRMVKQRFRHWEKECVCDPSLPVCGCDKIKEAKIIRPFPMKAEADEIRENSRARSARLRICEKVI